MKKFLLPIAALVFGFTANAGTIFNETLTSQASYDKFTAEDGNLTDGITYVWSFGGSSYGAKATAYVSGTRYAVNSWLVSPVIDLTNQTGVTFNFDNALNYLNGNEATDFSQVWVGEANTDKSTWTNVSSLVTFGSGSNWTFVNSGDISLASFEGKKIQIGFLYISTEEIATTWEVKNVTVVAGEADATPEFTVAEALAWLEEGNSGKAIVKGIISEISEIDTGSYGNATYFIKDSLTDEKSLEVYRGYGLDGAKFTTGSEIEVGDIVVVEGSLVDYNGTLEFTSGSTITSITKNSAVKNIENDNESAVYYNLQGVKVNNPVKGGIYIVNGKKVIL